MIDRPTALCVLDALRRTPVGDEAVLVGSSGLLGFDTGIAAFEDLSRIVGELNATSPLPRGGRALTPAGFVATKLLTERAHKGTKDKIQALLVIEERAGEAHFESELARLGGILERVGA